MKHHNNFATCLMVFVLLLISTTILNAQVHPGFTITKSIPTTPVKNQYMTGTCWCFATISFLETEALRLGKPAFDLSEMYIVKNAYTEKAKKYVRYHGMANFGEGGQAHDVLNMMRKYGLLMESDYPGLNYGTKVHNHTEMVSMLEGMLKNLISLRNNGPSSAWLPAFNAFVESYLGKAPTEIKLEWKKYDPVAFAKEVVGINPDDYVELTSYKDYPYYKKVDLELPDNWSHDLYYNVTIDDFTKVIDNALENGYSVAWDGDVSEDEFKTSEGKAVLSNEESDGILVNGIENMRQKTFDNFTTTDDHLMHITGLARDNHGTVYYLTKNSWGNNSNNYGGYIYMAKWYVQLKTIAIMVHKEAIPIEIRKKLGL